MFGCEKVGIYEKNNRKIFQHFLQTNAKSSKSWLIIFHILMLLSAITIAETPFVIVHYFIYCFHHLMLEIDPNKKEIFYFILC